MEADLRKQIYNNLNLRVTEELLEILQKNNEHEWDEEAFEIIKEILSKRLGHLPPESVRAQVEQLLDRVESYWKAGELDKALSDCELAIQMAPDSAAAYNYRGLIYDDLGQFEKAIADYQKALQLEPGLEDARDNLEIAAKEIEEEFQHSSAKGHLDQALAYTYDDQPGMALEECELARQSMPAVAIAYNYLGLILEELEQVEPAMDAYLRAVRLNPRFYAARENLANAKVKLEAEQYRKARLGDLERQQGEEESRPWDEDALASDLDESQGLESYENEDAIPGWVYMDEKAFILPGWPGHRTRLGRSGYDPLDLDFEEAHMEGVMIRLMLDGKFRTQNLFYLFLMTWVGSMLSLPLLLGGLSFLQGDKFIVSVLFFSSPYWIVGIALLRNVFLSFNSDKPHKDNRKGSAFF
jgi:tetratricopeptide (TPR) repeat protein